MAWKCGLITCLLVRAFRVCSTWQLFDDETRRLCGLFASNGYPRGLVMGVINKTLTRLLTPRATSGDSDSQPPREGLVPLLCIPYVGGASVGLASRLRRLLRPFCLGERIVFTTTKLRNTFSLKCATPSRLQSRVVYKFTCPVDPDTTYVGKTRRHLQVRAKEHFTSASSAVYQHISSCNSCQQQQDRTSCFTILATASNDHKLNVKEALFIKQLKPPLNLQLFKQGSSITTHIY